MSASDTYLLDNDAELERLELMLKTHDWYYDYSDDHSVWRAGQVSWDAIRRLRKQLEDRGMNTDALFHKYAPSA